MAFVVVWNVRGGAQATPKSGLGVQGIVGYEKVKEQNRCHSTSMRMVGYEYPDQVTDKNLEELVKRAVKIRKRTQDLEAVAILVLLAIVAAIIAPIAWYTRGYFSPPSEQPQLLLIIVILLATGVSFLAATFLADGVRLFLRRLNLAVSNFPTSEESIFAECLLMINHLNNNRVCAESWGSRFRSAMGRTGFLCDEFSLYSKDLLNVKRRVYRVEFRLLAGGGNQINRMLLFSGSKVKDLLASFALAFVKNKDVIAYRSLEKIVGEAEKYGSLENWFVRLENQLKSPMGIITLVGGFLSLAGGILALLARLLGFL